MSTTSYKLSIDIVIEEKLEMGKTFKFIYRIKNVDTKMFPGGTISVLINWPTFCSPYYVINPINIGQLQPDGIFEQPSTTRPEANPTVFSLNTIYPPRPGRINPATSVVTYFDAVDGVPIELQNREGTPITGGRIIHSVIARSPEEISEKNALWVAAISLVVLIFFQIIDWLIRYYLHF